MSNIGASPAASLIDASSQDHIFDDLKFPRAITKLAAGNIALEYQDGTQITFLDAEWPIGVQIARAPKKILNAGTTVAANKILAEF